MTRPFRRKRRFRLYVTCPIKADLQQGSHAHADAVLADILTSIESDVLGTAVPRIAEQERVLQGMLLHQMVLREQIEFSIRLNREGNLISKAILEGKARLHPGSYVIPDTPYTDQDRVKSQAEEKPRQHGPRILEV